MTHSDLPEDLLAELDRRRREGVSVSYGECVGIQWRSGWQFYAISRFDQAPNYPNWPTFMRPLSARLRLTNGGPQDSAREWLLAPPEMIAFNHTHDFTESSISFGLRDEDLSISELFFDPIQQGIARVVVLGYFAEIDTPLVLWYGRTSPAAQPSQGVLQITATFGYDTNMRCPRRVQSGTRCDAVARFGGKLKTLAEVLLNDCPYGAHVGGIGNIDPVTGKPYVECDGLEPSCFARIGGDRERLPILNFTNVYPTERVGRVGGPNTLARTESNDSLLNVPLRVVFGERDVSQVPGNLIQIQNAPAGSKPENGSVSLIYDVADHHCAALSAPEIAGQQVAVAPGTNKNQFLYALGEIMQAPLYLTGVTKAPNRSGVARFRGLIFGAFAGKKIGDFPGKVHVVGNDEIEYLTGDAAGQRGHSTNRAECLYWLLTNKRAGAGESGETYLRSDFTTLATQCAELRIAKTSQGVTEPIPRSRFDATIEGRELRQVLRDVCLAGRFTLPHFSPYVAVAEDFSGRKRIGLLSKAGAAAPVVEFRDETYEGRAPNCDLIEPIPLALDYDQFKGWWEDREHGDVQRPEIIDYVGRRDARAAALGGSPPPQERERPLLGTIYFGEAVRVSLLAANTGDFGDGGWENPLRVHIRGPWMRPEFLRCHPYMEITVRSRWLAVHKETTSQRVFERFMVLSVSRDSRGYCDVLAQAIPIDWLERMESDTEPPVVDGSTAMAALPEIEQTDETMGLDGGIFE